MRHLWAAGCALALVGLALALGSPAASASTLARRPHHLVATAPTLAPDQQSAAQAPVVNVSPTQASSGQTVTVSGAYFPPNTRVQVYLDGPNHPLGSSVVVGANGTFSTPETVPAGATAAVHQICAQVNIQTPACAQLQVIAAVTTPTPQVTPTPLPSPTATPAVTPSTPATPPQQSDSVLASLFPWILIPIAILVILAVVAIALILRNRGPRDGTGTGAGPGPLPTTYGDPRGAGQPTVTHRSPRGYQAPGEPPAGPARRGYWRRGRVTGAPPPGEPLPGGDDRPGLGRPGAGGPGLPGGGQGRLPGDDRGRLPGSDPGSLPPGTDRRRLPPGDGDDPLSAPPRR